MAATPTPFSYTEHEAENKKDARVNHMKEVPLSAAQKTEKMRVVVGTA
jgi:hypothetical protein